LLISPFLIDGYAKVCENFWFSYLDNSKNFENFKQELYLDNIPVSLKPKIIYRKLD
jgi:hypothetical protein